MSNIVSLSATREANATQRAIERAIDQRDLSMVAEVERRFAEAMGDVAELGGVSIDYLHALMRAAWGLPEQGGVDLISKIQTRAGTLNPDPRARPAFALSPPGRPHLFNQGKQAEGRD